MDKAADLKNHKQYAESLRFNIKTLGEQKRALALELRKTHEKIYHLEHGVMRGTIIASSEGKRAVVTGLSFWDDGQLQYVVGRYYKKDGGLYAMENHIWRKWKAVGFEHNLDELLLGS